MRIVQKTLCAAVYPVGLGMVALLASASKAQSGSATVDLAGGDSGTVNGARFEWTPEQPTGTGFIDSFVRIQNTGTEQGYNTSGRPFAFDEKEPLNFTHDVQLSQLGSGVTVGGTEYYQFLLDINEPGASKKSELSLDSLQIYTSPVGSQNTKDVSSLGALRYDLGPNNWILLDASRNSGSGSGDMFAFIPKSNFAGASPNDYVYLFSKFGLHADAQGGFEEWAAVVKNNPTSGGGSPPQGSGGNPPPSNGGGGNPPPSNGGGGNPPEGTGGGNPPPSNGGGGNPPEGTGGGNPPPSSGGGGNPPEGIGGGNPPPGGTPGAVPEPSTYAMLGSFLALTAFLKRRRSTEKANR